jgi:hypothetical protein
VLVPSAAGVIDCACNCSMPLAPTSESGRSHRLMLVSADFTGMPLEAAG